MKKIAVLLAPGFEEVEAVAPVDVWRRIGLQVTPAAAGSERRVTGAHGMALTAEASLADLDPAEFDAVVCPGGMPGSRNLRDDPAVIAFVRAVYERGGIAAAICAAPMVLNRAGLLDGRRFTMYPGMEGECAPNRPTGAVTERDGRVITGRGPGAAFAFAAEVAAALGEEAAARQVLAGMLVG